MSVWLSGCLSVSSHSHNSSSLRQIRNDCHCVYLSVYLSVCPSRPTRKTRRPRVKSAMIVTVCLSVCLAQFVCWSLFICLSVFLNVCLCVSVYLSTRLSVFLCLSVHPSVRPSVRQSVRPYVRSSVPPLYAIVSSPSTSKHMDLLVSAQRSEQNRFASAMKGATPLVTTLSSESSTHEGVPTMIFSPHGPILHLRENAV